MYIQSKTKDVLFTVVSGVLLLAIALTWNAGNHAKNSLEICEFKLSNCEKDLRWEKENNKRLTESNNKSLDMVKNTFPTLDQHKAIMEMMYRRIKNGEVSKSMMTEYEKILKNQ